MSIRIPLLVIFLMMTNYCLSQSNDYFRLVKTADSLYKAKDYKKAALGYSTAFRVNGWRALWVDRYNAACSWALSGNADSAFHCLYRLAGEEKFSKYEHVTNDPDLTSLHADNRWASLVAWVLQNKEKEEAKLNKPLVAKLDSIFMNDQRYRQQIAEIEKKYGFDSKEMKGLLATMRQKDSINLITVTELLDSVGWLGPDEVGQQGNATLFLVIQHSDQKTQEKYLPLMRKAVQQKKAQASHLALLEDRVALGQGKKQIYGSQIERDEKSGRYYVAPIEDEPNVNQRRAAVGLEPLEVYAGQWGIDYKLPKK